MDETETKLRELAAIVHRLVDARTTVRGTEMDPVLGPEYRLHGIHFNRAEEMLRSVNAHLATLPKPPEPSP